MLQNVTNSYNFMSRKAHLNDHAEMIIDQIKEPWMTDSAAIIKLAQQADIGITTND